MGKFQGKVALVTGGSSGMGRAAALAFAREGARVIVADKNVEGGEETVKMIEKVGGEAAFVKTDVSQAAQVEELVVIQGVSQNKATKFIEAAKNFMTEQEEAKAAEEEARETEEDKAE